MNKLFIRQLAFLLLAGIPLLDCLKLLHARAFKRKAKASIQEVMNAVLDGKILSVGFREAGVGSPFVLAMVEVGEITGTLGQSLEYASEELDKSERLRKKVAGALAYPALVCAAGLFVSLSMTFFIFPKILPIFKESNVPLPLTTKLLIYMTDFSAHYWLQAILAFVLISFLFIFAFYKSLVIQKKCHILALSLPFVRVCFQNIMMVDFCRNLSLLLKSGLKLDQSVGIIRDSCRHPLYKEAYDFLLEDIHNGQPICQFLCGYPLLFPSLSVELIAVGESTGKLPETLNYLEGFHEEGVDSFAKSLSSLVEPALMIVIGIFIGFVAISIITPIYEITQTIHR